MRAFSDQRDGVGHRVLGGEGDGGVSHQITALDEVDGLPDGLEGEVLGKHHDAAAPCDGLGHPPAGDRSHIRHHDRNGGAGAVRGRQVDIEPGGDIGAVRDHEDVVVGQVVAWPLAIQKAHGGPQTSISVRSPLHWVWNRALGSASIRP